MLCDVSSATSSNEMKARVRRPTTARAGAASGAPDGAGRAGVAGRTPARAATAIIITLILSIALAACSVQQHVRMESAVAAQSDMEVMLAEELHAYLLDLSGVLGVDPEDASPFDLEQLALLLDEEPGLVLLDAEIPANDRLTMSLRAEDLERVLTEGPHRVEGLIETESRQNEHTLTIELDRDRMQQITGLSPVEEQSAVEFLLPPERMNEEEYVEYLAWAMEEYESDTPIEDVIRDARIEVRVEVPGELLSVSGGDVDGNTAVFYERVVTLLTVREPTRWSVTWRH